MSALDLLVRLILAGALGGGVYVLALAALDCHQRGMARVHRGRSWSARIPEQRR